MKHDTPPEPSEPYGPRVDKNSMRDLRERLDNETFIEELRQALVLAAATGTIAAPVSHSRLLESVVETAAHMISAKAAALFLIDEQTQELVFEVALGQKAEEVKKFRVPLGHGIAGLVAITGQPMAVSDVQSDSRHASDIAQAVDYLPQSILCLPLFHNDVIIGVIELLDKQGASSFDADDMEALGYFANITAIAIEQSRTRQNLAVLMDELLTSLDGLPIEVRERLRQRSSSFAERLEQSDSFRRAIELARLVQSITKNGEREASTCATMLRGFADYLNLRSTFTSDPGVIN